MGVDKKIMTMLVIKVEVEVEDFEVDLFNLKDDFAIEAQADFVKDALRNTGNNITWTLHKPEWVQRIVNSYKRANKK